MKAVYIHYINISNTFHYKPTSKTMQFYYISFLPYINILQFVQFILINHIPHSKQSFRF